MRLGIPLLLISAALLSNACASSSRTRATSTDTVRLSNTDTPPELLGCGNYNPPPGGGTTGVNETHVAVEFVIDQAGRVPQGSARVRRVRENVTTKMERVRDQAITDAELCTFRPALRNGEPIPVRHRMTFSYLAL